MACQTAVVPHKAGVRGWRILKFFVLLAWGVATISPLSASTGVSYLPENRAFPCISDVSCETVDEMDSTLVSVSVEYYDDLGTAYVWTRLLHSREGFTDCEKAMEDYFPYPFFQMCRSMNASNSNDTLFLP